MEELTQKQQHEQILANIQATMYVLFEYANLLNIKDGGKFKGKNKKKETVITVQMDSTFASNMRKCTCTSGASTWTIKFHPDDGTVIDTSEFDDQGNRISGSIEFTSPKGTTDEGIRALFELLHQITHWNHC